MSCTNHVSLAEYALLAPPPISNTSHAAPRTLAAAIVIFVVAVIVLNGASAWIAPLEMDIPSARIENGVGVNAAYKGPSKARFKQHFEDCNTATVDHCGRNAEL